MTFRMFPGLMLAVAGLSLAGCSSSSEKTQSLKSLDPFAGTGSPIYAKGGKIPLGGGRRQVGKPYQVAGRWFHPKEQPGYDRRGTASWYGEAFHRRQTSNGEWFDMNQLTAAHPTLPLPSYAKVTNLENGQSIIVRINDRGPFVGTRLIDLSKRSAEALGYKNNGKTEVRVQLIGPAPLDDRGVHLAAMNRELQRGTPLNRMVAAAGGGETDGVQMAAYEPPRKPARRKAAPEPVIAEADPAIATRSQYFVQVASFSDPINAALARDELAGVAPVEVRPLESTSGTIYRVRLGPMANEGEAESALAAAVDQGHGGARLIVAQVET